MEKNEIFELPSLEELPEGPWSVDPQISVVVRDINGADLAHVYHCPGRTREQEDATARTIAAIPDMIRQIERLRTPWRVQLDSYRAENDRLRALIVELEGALAVSTSLMSLLIEDGDPPNSPLATQVKVNRAILAKAKTGEGK